MFIPDEEKEGRKASLAKLLDMVKGHTGSKLGAMKKKPEAEVSVEIEADPMAEEEIAEEDVSEGPSEEEKAKIAELYHKFCE